MSENKETVEVEETEKPMTKKQIAAEKAQAKEDAKIPEGTMVTCDDGEDRAVIYRDTAVEQGLNRYFTGEKCRNGHMVERKVKGYVCTTCARLRQKERHKARLASDSEYKAKFAKKRADKHKKRYAEDPEYREKVLGRAKDRRAKKTAEKGKAKAEKEITDKAEAEDTMKADAKAKAAK